MRNQLPQQRLLGLVHEIALAFAVLTLAPSGTRAQTDVHNTGTAGNWTAAATWQGGVVPNNGTPPGSTYNAFLDAAGTYTVSLNSSSTPPSITVSNLTLNNAGATLTIGGGGTLNIVSSATLIAGAIQMNGGTLSGGTYSSSGGVIQFASNSNNILSNVTLNSAGVIDLSPGSSFARLEGTTNLPAGSYTIGNGSTLDFNQAATLTGVNLTLGSNSASIFVDGGNTLTIGATSSVTVGAASITATLGTNRLNANAGTVLLNQGTVGFAAGATSSTLNISVFQGGGSFQNSGTLQANTTGSTVTIGLPLTNLAGGQIVASTGTINLNGGFNNQGTFVVSGGTLNLAGAFTTAQIGTVNHTAGTVNITGALNNAGNTLALTDAGANPTGSFTLSGGSITGGTITIAGAAHLLATNSSNNILSNVILGSPSVIDLSPGSSFARLEGTTNLPAGSYTIGNGSTLDFNQAATLTGVNLTLGSNSASIFVDGGNTLTIGATSSVTVGAASITATLGTNRLNANAGTVLLNQGTVGFAAGATSSTLNISVFQGGGSFQNSGTLQANTTGSTVTIGLPLTNLAGGQIVASTGTINLNGGFNNQGTFVVSGGTLNLAGAFTTAQIGTVNHTAGTVNITGALNNAGNTLALTDAGANPTGSFTLSGGSITGGTITIAGAAHLLATNSSNNILSNVILGSPSVIDLSPSSSFFRLEGTTTLPTASYTIGNGSTLDFNQAATLTGVNLTLGSNSASIFVDGGNTLTIGATSSVTVGAASITATLGTNRLNANAGTVLLNQGTVGFAAGATSSTLNISVFQGGGSFQNSGTLQANTTGSTVTIGLPLTNLAGGQIVASTGTINLNGGFNNQGTFVVSGGTLNLAGAFTTAQIGTVNHTAGTVNITGALNNAGNTLALTDAGANPTGSFTLSGGSITGGTITIAGAAHLLATNSSNNILSNVILGSPSVIDLSPSSSFFRLEGTTTLPTASYTIGNGSTLDFNQAATLTGVNLTLGSNSASIFVDGGNTLTIGATSSVTVGAASITATLGTNRLNANAGTVLLNQGTVGFAAGATSSTLNISVFQGGGSFQNSGTLQANTTGSTVTISLPTFTNTGTLAANGGTVSVAAATNFTNFSAGTLTGGTYQDFPSSVINFNGRVITTIGAGTTVLLDGASSVFTAANTIATNNGTFTISNGRQHTVGTFTNSGTLVVGTAQSDLALLNANVQVNSGIVKGTGTIAGTLSLASGTTLAPGGSPGILKVTGAVTMSAGSTFSIDLSGNTAGSGYSQLNLTGGGSVNLNNATFLNSLGYAPADTDSFTIITGGPVSGIFNGLPNGTTVILGSFGGGTYKADIQYTSNAVMLINVVPEPACVLLICASVGGAVSAIRRRSAHRRR